MEEQLDRIAKALEGDEPEEGTPLECIAHALESIAKSMDPSFRRLYLQRADFADSLHQAVEAIQAAQRLQDSRS
jgi:hypothetical protein